MSTNSELRDLIVETLRELKTPQLASDIGAEIRRKHKKVLKSKEINSTIYGNSPTIFVVDHKADNGAPYWKLTVKIDKSKSATESKGDSKSRQPAAAEEKGECPTIQCDIATIFIAPKTPNAHRVISGILQALFTEGVKKIDCDSSVEGQIASEIVTKYFGHNFDDAFQLEDLY